MNEDSKAVDKSVEGGVQYSVTEVKEAETTRQAVSETDLLTEQWQPGFWKRFPWLGAVALCTIVFVCIIEVIVLLLSNNKAASQWNKPVIKRYPKATWPSPNVILSIFNSMTSIAITVAVGQGIAIAWWRKALKGTSIKELHNTWSFGGSITSIVLNLKYFNFAALAAVVTKLTIIDSVLFQRATTTYVALGPQRSHNVSTYPTFKLPQTATVNNYLNGTTSLDYFFTFDIDTWLSSAYGNIYSTYGYGDCEGICALNITQPGYYAQCTQQEKDVDVTTIFPTGNETEISTEIFGVTFSINYDTPKKNYTWIGLNFTSYDVRDPARVPANNTQDCPGTIYTTQCELRQGYINYPVFMQKSNAATGTNNGQDSSSYVDVYLGYLDTKNGTYVDLGDFDYDLGQLPEFMPWKDLGNVAGGVPTPGGTTSNGGFYAALRDSFTSHAYVKSNTSQYWEINTEGQFASVMQWVPDTTPEYNVSVCPWTFKDPATHIMTSLNMLTFITADDPYTRENWTTTTLSGPEYENASRSYQEAIQYVSEVHYHTNLGFMFGALGSTFVCILLVLPVYYGFWELGRPVSLNPIEVATAFQAPMLMPLQPKTSHADDVVKVAGSQMIKYADVVEGPGGKRLRFVARDHGNASV